LLNFIFNISSSFLRIFGITPQSQAEPDWTHSYDVEQGYQLQKNEDGCWHDPTYSWDVKFLEFEKLVSRVRSMRNAIELFHNKAAKKFTPDHTVDIDDMQVETNVSKHEPIVDAFTAQQIIMALSEQGADSGIWDAETRVETSVSDVTYSGAPNSLSAPQVHTQSNEEPDNTVTEITCQSCKAVHTAGFEFCPNCAKALMVTKTKEGQPKAWAIIKINSKVQEWVKSGKAKAETVSKSAYHCRHHHEKYHN
jgi:hypothetical protein